MTYAQLLTLAGLVVVVAVAGGTVALLLRATRPAPAQRGGIVQGYPASLFPQRELTNGGPLAELAATQGRLLAMYEQVPAHSDLAVWLRTFLHELREIMDTAYRVALIGSLYGQAMQVERLVREVQAIEAGLADHVLRQLLKNGADREQEELEGRLATLRLCVRELGGEGLRQPATSRS